MINVREYQNFIFIERIDLANCGAIQYDRVLD